MRNPRQVAVVGVTGYSGLELARILLRHPALQPPVFYVRETNGAKCLAELFPQFRGWGEAPLRPLSVDAITSSSAGTAFLATPHEVSAELAPALLKAGLRVVEVDENFKAYGLFTHRHTPEILEHTGLSESQVVFSTHLLPLARGILSTIYVTLAEPQAAADIEALYRKFYAGRPMVRIWAAGTLPELQHVAHTNFCDIGFALDKSGRRLVIVSCLDNLGKGAAGQAVQNFNHMLGIEEQTSLQ